MRVPLFAMERWQSTFEHRVDFNLSESGVHPLNLAELFELIDLFTKGQTNKSLWLYSPPIDELQEFF